MPYEEDNYVDEMPDYENYGYENHDFKRDTFWLKRPDNDLIIRAENGDAEAQYQIGKIFFEAYHDDVESTSPIKMEGVDDFYDEAINWLTKSAQQDNLGAQICLSNLYLYSIHRRLPGGDYFVEKSKYWVEKAAKSDKREGMHALGCWYEWLYADCGELEDAQHAYYYYRVAARNGYTPAMCDLAMCYKDGVGVGKNLTKARYWLERAKNGGDEDASRLLLTLDE